MFKSIIKTILAVAAATLLFSCEKPAPFLTVDQKAVSFEAAAGEKTINFSTNLGEFSTECQANWVYFEVDILDGSGTIKISVEENQGVDARSAELIIGNETLKETIAINQIGAAPSILIDMESADVLATGESVSVSITSNAVWTATASEGADWLFVNPIQGEGNGTVVITVQPNVLLETREASVVFKAGQSEKVLAIKQAAGVASRYTDSLALVAVYNAADGANWAKNNWDLSQPIDKWNGVTVNAESGRVTALKITAAGVITKEWTLPAEIGNLSELTDLRFNGSKVAGEIPESVFGLAKLEKLYLQNNNISGTLSASIANLSEISELYIDRNANLGGTLNAVCSLKKLKSINISVTSIGGAIPAELVGCEALTNFMAYSNKLEGQIPDIWDKLPNIGVLQLYGNPGITGPIPATIGSLKKATGIQMKECNLTGNIPATFGGLEKCGNLQLNGNKLSGEVPAEVIAHPKWLPTSGWKYETNILPQQDGYVLTLPAEAPAISATWSFNPDKTYESGKDFEMNKTTGSWVLSDDGQARLSVNRVSGVDASKISTYTTDETWGEKVYRFLSYSVYLNDYWQFEVPAKKHDAGKCNVKFSMSASAAGPKVFVIEYSTDGSTWTAVNTKKTNVRINEEPEYEVTYTFILSPEYKEANVRHDIDETFDIPAAAADGTFYVRARVNDTITNKMDKALNGESHGGTNRIGKFASVTFEK